MSIKPRAEPPKSAEIVNLFDEAPVAEEVQFQTHKPPQQTSFLPTSPIIDLTDKPKVLMVVGAGNTGKTTFLRWAVETAIFRQGEIRFASVDPQKRALKDYYPTCMEPPGYKASQVVPWLEQLLTAAMSKRVSVFVDFGAGDASLRELLESSPDLAGFMGEAGIAPVLLTTLSPRIDDLSSLAALTEAGFMPAATAIVLNEGASDTARPREHEFRDTLRHSVFKAAVARGAVPIWPTLFIDRDATEAL